MAAGHCAPGYLLYQQFQASMIQGFPVQHRGSFEHTKHCRGLEKYRGKVLAFILFTRYPASLRRFIQTCVCSRYRSQPSGSAQSPIYAVVRGRHDAYFGDGALRRAPISNINSKYRSLHFETALLKRESIIISTGYGSDRRFHLATGCDTQQPRRGSLSTRLLLL